MNISKVKNYFNGIIPDKQTLIKKANKAGRSMQGIWLKATTSKFEKWIDKASFKRKIKQHGKKALSSAIGACEKIWKLKEQGKLGLSTHSLFEIALFIETKLPKYISKHKYHLDKKTTGLNRSIEYDPKTKRVFIDLRSSLGSGVHKKVTKALLYDSKKPLFIACAKSSEKCAAETRVHKKFKHKQGLAQTYAITHHKGTTSLFLKLYNGHSLRHHQYNRGELSKKEMAIITRDLLYGLEHLHKHNLVHCDLHGGNALMDKSGKKISAALIDFGRTKRVGAAKKKGPRIHASARTNPPEVFMKGKNISAKAVDIYALGCQLYHLNYGKELELPSKGAFVHAFHAGRGQQHSFGKVVRADLKKLQAQRKQQIDSHRKSSSYDLFQKIILKMCHNNPSSRGTAHSLRKKLDNIIKNWNST
ncbi:MAG: protein kinase [Verrucomicrobia bacterium]|nr:protein kinase [Verrucomicrobiota bacterium]